MNLEKFIFSNHLSHRVLRHVTFWAIYCIFYYIQSLVPEPEKMFANRHIYNVALVSVYCFVPVSIFSLYITTYVIFPFFVKKKRYAGTIVMVIAVFAADLALNYAGSLLFFSSPLVQNSNVKITGVWSLGYLNTVIGVITIGIGLFFKMAKMSYLQQRENVDIAKRKTRTELDLEKSRLQPVYLYTSLHDIQRSLASGSGSPDKMILKLSEVLSYSLYECDRDLVSLEKELNVVREFMDLEMLRHNGTVNMYLINSVEDESFSIRPMLILSALQETTAMLERVGNKEWELFIEIASTGSSPEVIISVSGYGDVARFSIENMHHNIYSTSYDFQ